MSFDETFAIATAVITAVVVFIIKVIWTSISDCRRNAASVDLLRSYAEISIALINEALKPEPEDNEKEIARNIMDDNPDNDYTPYIIQSEEDKLSFDTIRDVFQHTKKNERDKLIAYFVAEANLGAIGNAINSDFVRSLPQERKLSFWKAHIKYSRETLEAAEAFVGKADNRKE